jgi:hypothetical protein
LNTIKNEKHRFRFRDEFMQFHHTTTTSTDIH